MGAWGDGPFDNDDAADWAAQLDDADQEAGLRLIESALRQAAQESADGYLDCDDGAIAVAAAELVARFAGQPASVTSASESTPQWAARVSPQVATPLASLAIQAAARVTGPRSELASLWDEAGTSWRASMTDLASRLQAAQASSLNANSAEPGPLDAP